MSARPVSCIPVLRFFKPIPEIGLRAMVDMQFDNMGNDTPMRYRSLQRHNVHFFIINKHFG